MTEKRYEIPAENLGKLQKRFDQLARKAEKLGFPPPELKVLGERFVEEKKLIQGEWLGAWITRKVFDIEIEGQSPKLEGWSLVAVIDHFTSGQRGVNLIRRFPHLDEIEIPDEYRTTDQRCEHCNLLRYRKDTFALLNEDGEWKLVGRQCLKDFTGHKSPEALARWASRLHDLLIDAQEDDWSGEWITHYLKLDDYLAIVAWVIDEYGWTSRTKAREDFTLLSTADRALHPDTLKEASTAEFKELVAEVIKWSREELATKDRLNDYEWNLVASLAEDYFHQKNAGLAASSIMAYKKAQGLLNENGNGPVSQHQGEVGERIDRVLTIEKRLDLDSHWGVYRITIMSDEAGNVYVWKTNSQKLAEGETYKVRGTVKEHDQYNGTAQTVLARCKVVHEPCGEMNYWFGDNGWVCYACEELEK